MKPLQHPYATATLLSLRFYAAPARAVSGDRGLQVAVEDNAFVSWWRPFWRERLRILCGAPIRVLVNYSDGGPLRVDIGSSWGNAG